MGNSEGSPGSQEPAAEPVQEPAVALDPEEAAARRRARALAAEQRVAPEVAAASPVATGACPSAGPSATPPADPAFSTADGETYVILSSPEPEPSPSPELVDLTAEPPESSAQGTEDAEARPVGDDLMAEPDASAYGTEDAEARLVRGLVQRIAPELPHERAVECYETLSRVFGNLLQSPSDPKFRMIKKASLRKKLGNSPEALSLLLIVGFDDQGDLYTLHPSGTMSIIRVALAEVQTALLNLGSIKALRYLQHSEGCRAPPPPAVAASAGSTKRTGDVAAAATVSQAAPASTAEPLQSTPPRAAAPLQVTAMAVDSQGATPKRKAPEAAQQQLIVRLTSTAGRSRLALPHSATLGDLRAKVEAVSGIRASAQRLSLEPSDRRLLTDDPATRLADLGIESGAALYLSNADATMVNVKVDSGEVKAALEASALRKLRADQINCYWSDGVLGPLNGPDFVQTARCRDGLQRYFAQSRGRFEQRIFHGHVLQPWLYDLACHPSIVGAVASVLRTDTVLLYQSILIPRPPGEIGIGWHADGGGYRPLQPARDFITAFVALSRCRKENGCLEFEKQSNGTRFLMELDEGQFSLHSGTVQHTTTRNTAATHRVCVVFRYISGEVYDVARGHNADRDFAVLVSGKDTKGHFRLLRRPDGECTPDAQEIWEEMKHIREERYGKLV